jgi:competence protein ComEA
MFTIPQFSDIQKRAAYIVLATSIAVGSLFFTLSQGKASVPKPMVSLAPMAAIPSAPAIIVVDVSGKVLHPGVYTLPSGSRAIDAIKAAGNQLKGVSLNDINLAQIVSDGEQIVVGAPAVVVSQGRSKSSSKIVKSSKMLVNINSATVLQLEVLKGVGPVSAQKVISYRKANGLFTSLDIFKKAAGLGAAKYNLIKSQLRL